jgi:hypothetical protein
MTLLQNKKHLDLSGQTDLLIENGLQFIERGVQELWNEEDKNHLKHSVINFCAGVELLLKARLMMEHWTLIISDIKTADTESFVEGNFRSVSLDETIIRLKKIVNVEIGNDAQKVFRGLRTHRNQIVHFYHQTDLTTKDGKRRREQVIKEQCNGWFYLRRLIGDLWQEKFRNYQQQLLEINMLMKRHRAYLESVYEKIQPELDKEEKKGANLGSCYSCGFVAHVIDELGPSVSRCRVCTNTHSFLRHKCQNCDHIFLIDDGTENIKCPKCDDAIDLPEIMDAYSEEGQMGHKDFMIDGGYGNCAECEGYQTVGTIADISFCFQCHQFQETMGVCEWCNEKATGDLEFSYHSGCVICDGHAGWDNS